ncbi:sensor histidine kinase [Polyangium aurulentum]|uniref:sensor histidine kinase n=1 Tax=Polyangium aurulentum TaxID=2567896 RepID=UPI00146B1C8D|nr:ATP-binding protein [Polyangium aurulentum]UQA62648.1 ATP-binding protein [Polyangium aurulentum]
MSATSDDANLDELVALLAAAHDENAALRREVVRLRRQRDEALAAGNAARLDLMTFFGLVAHQLKHPLLPLHLSLVTLMRALERGLPIPPDTLPRTVRQTRRLGRLIDALLVDLPRVEDGSLHVAIASFDLRDPVRAATDEMRTMIASRTFVLDEPACEVPVRGDVERIEQIVASMLDNALKYSPPGTTIEVRVVVDGGGEAMVTVKDQGIGIPARELGQVFTKFYRGSNAPSYLYRGLGVGLYLAQSLAGLCHGRLSLDSVEGEGTICRLHLPIDR